MKTYYIQRRAFLGRIHDTRVWTRWTYLLEINFKCIGAEPKIASFETESEAQRVLGNIVSPDSDNYEYRIIVEEKLTPHMFDTQDSIEYFKRNREALERLRELKPTKRDNLSKVMKHYDNAIYALSHMEMKL